MPKCGPQVPKYRLHKARNQAAVVIDGHWHYLGRYGSPESHAEYDRLIGEWIVSGRRSVSVERGFTVNDLLLRYMEFAKQYYCKDGVETTEIACLRIALRPIRRLYGRIDVAEFGPLALKAVINWMIERKYARSTINLSLSRIKRVFKWGTAEELVDASTFHALQAVTGLRAGRTSAKETQPVRPVPDEFVDAVLPSLPRQVRAMVELQRLTGMRSGEVVQMRACDLDMSCEVWEYTPERHKTQHKAKERVIPIGKRAQEIIRPFLTYEPTRQLFSPRDAECERRAVLHAIRKTPLSCGNRPREGPKWQKLGDAYTNDAYRRAITRAIKKVNSERNQRELPEIPHWSPHQLRHSYATKVRREFGIEAASVALGHHGLEVTQVYAERDLAKAREVARRIG